MIAFIINCLLWCKSNEFAYILPSISYFQVLFLRVKFIKVIFCTFVTKKSSNLTLYWAILDNTIYLYCLVVCKCNKSYYIFTYDFFDNSDKTYKHVPQAKNNELAPNRQNLKWASRRSLMYLESTRVAIA